MPTFGFAAFLKIASLNPKPRKTELRKRLFGSGQPYDFHRSLKLASRKFVVEGFDLGGLLVGAEDVVKVPERNSLINGLKKLGLWREGVTGAACKIAPKVYQSPRGIYKIAIQPEFGIDTNGRRIAFQIWNTKKPDLDVDAVYGTIALLPALYTGEINAPSDFGVLSLHEPRVYLVSDRVVSPLLIDRVIGTIEDGILDIYKEYGEPPSKDIHKPTPPH